MRRVLANYQYQKDIESVLPNLKAYIKDGVVHLDGYRRPWKRSNPPYIGVCDELALHAALELQKSLGQHYAFRVVEGQCPKYFGVAGSNHIYIIAWPWNKEVENNRIFDFIDPEEGITLPEDCLIIDPSFPNTLGLAGDMPGYSCSRPLYRLWKITPPTKGEHVDPVRFEFTQPNGSMYPITGTRPLGLLRIWDEGFPARVPELKDYAEAMLHFNFLQFRPQDEPALQFLIQKTPSSLILDDPAADIWTGSLPPEHPLRQFERKVNSQLKASFAFNRPKES